MTSHDIMRRQYERLSVMRETTTVKVRHTLDVRRFMSREERCATT